jgi:hypothetical protein
MLRAVAIGAFSTLAVGCASPTLPLPPPEPPSQEAGFDADHVKLYAGCGNVAGGAIIVVVNVNTSVPGDQAVSGAIASSCGSWDAMVYAHRGDVLQVTQELGTVVSPPAVVQVRIGGGDAGP